MFEPSTISREQVEGTLVKFGIGVTRQRVDIGTCLLGEDRHVTADQVLLEVHSKIGADVSKATVYNTLGLFARKGLLKEVVVDPNRLVYDTNTSEHHHIYNVDTGMLQDVDKNELSLTSMPDMGDGVEVEGVDVIIRVRASRS
ncbi:MAG: Fur family transcriptional regulator [bacterium]